jgi:transposase-like protein
MICPHCQSPELRKLNQTTGLGYAEFRCGGCRRKSNERTGTPFNYLELPTDIVFEIVLCRLRYKLSLRDLAEMFLLRGFEFTHEAVRDWEERFAPLLAEHIRRKRKGKAGRRWYVDETYLKVKGKWCYLYRAIDRDGNLVDSMLSATRDMDAAQRFFRSAESMVNRAPTQVTRMDMIPTLVRSGKHSVRRWSIAAAHF